MERKYYLRGLGLGIVITAVIMGVALSGRRAMTDDEIIARAKELGMVENTVLADAGDAAEAEAEVETDADAARQEETESVDTEQTQEDTAGHTDGEAGAEDRLQEAESAESVEAVPGDQYATPGAPQGEVPSVAEEEPSEDMADASAAAPETPGTEAASEMVITINSGDGSYTVAKKLAAAGVVTSAENFDTFLCANGYDKKLRTGDFSIPADASDEQIARIVTGAE